jgi:hypothetical protein
VASPPATSPPHRLSPGELFAARNLGLPATSPPHHHPLPCLLHLLHALCRTLLHRPTAMLVNLRSTRFASCAPARVLSLELRAVVRGRRPHSRVTTVARMAPPRRPSSRTCGTGGGGQSLPTEKMEEGPCGVVAHRKRGRWWGGEAAGRWRSVQCSAHKRWRRQGSGWRRGGEVAGGSREAKVAGGDELAGRGRGGGEVR